MIENIDTCRACVHKSVCRHFSTMIALQRELFDNLKHSSIFTVAGKYDRAVKISNFDFIKTVKIECEYYLRDASISED